MWLNLSNIVLRLSYRNVSLPVFNGLQRSMSTACKHIVHNCKIFYMQNYTKYLSYIFVMHKAHYFVLCCLWLCHFLAYLFWMLKHVHTFYISKLFQQCGVFLLFLVFNGLQRSMSTACKHIVHNCKIFYMQNVLSPSFYNFDIWFCNCSDSVVYICFFFIKANEQIVKTKDYKNTYVCTCNDWRYVCACKYIEYI
jgi:hypothetical protein